MSDLKLGALMWSQHADRPKFLAAGASADELGFDSLRRWVRGHATEAARSAP